MSLLGSRWGDDDDEVLPPRTESQPDANGIRTIVEWKFNADGKKVKVTKKVKQVVRVTKENKRIQERKEWIKFGLAENGKDDSNVTYTSNEDIYLEDPNADQVQPGQKKEEENVFSGVKNSSIVVCRHCGMVGDHWTLKCPYKDTPSEQLKDGKCIPVDGGKSGEKTSGLAALADGKSSGKYVPPNMRGKSSESSSSSSQDDRDNATLRVTNISTDADQDDLKELFSQCGAVSRVFLAKDRETMKSRGFAFISYYNRKDAERAMEELQGYGFHYLILKIEWAKPSGKSKDEGSKGTSFRSGYGKALPQMRGPARK